jgi:hypothetical protein
MSGYGDGTYGDWFYGGPDGNRTQVNVTIAPARVHERVQVAASRTDNTTN